MAVRVGVSNIGGVRLLPDACYTDIARGLAPDKLTKSQIKLVNLYEAVKNRINYGQLYSSCNLACDQKDGFSYVDGYMNGIIDGMGLRFEESEDVFTVYSNKTVILICEKPCLTQTEKL